MDTYLVGGAVRDQLLHLPVVDRDWVVVNSSIAAMQAAGFTQVGQDFPVFLHPETKEEYALARVERKTGTGYGGFSTDASKHVTLEQDLQRRDLTINAIAQTVDGVLIDPYHGQQDLNAKILRHVSSAFTEDPLRVLRVARFAARFADLGFTIAAETNALMQAMVASGELAALSAERVWIETQKSLEHNGARVYFETLDTIGALAALFPELTVSTCLDQSLNCLAQSQKSRNSSEIHWAVLLHAVGKTHSLTQVVQSSKGQVLIERLCCRLRVPKRYTALATLVAQYHQFWLSISRVTAEQLLELLTALGCFRNKSMLEDWLRACHAIGQGLGRSVNGHSDETDSNEIAISRDFSENSVSGTNGTNGTNGTTINRYIRDALQAALAFDMQALLAQNLKGAAIGAELKAKRLALLQAFVLLRQAPPLTL